MVPVSMLGNQIPGTWESTLSSYIWDPRMWRGSYRSLESCRCRDIKHVGLANQHGRCLDKHGIYNNMNVTLCCSLDDRAERPSAQSRADRR